MGEKYIFIDRDGVINEDADGWTDHGYVTKWEDFHFLPKVLEAFRKIKQSGYKSVIISNQQCVGKGIITAKVLDEITAKMVDMIKKYGGDVAGIYYCTHKKEDNCDCRKPKPGLFEKAKHDLKIGSIRDMYFIGDTERDVVAGKAAGLGTITVFSGKTIYGDEAKFEVKPDHVSYDLMDAVEYIIRKENE